MAMAMRRRGVAAPRASEEVSLPPVYARRRAVRKPPAWPVYGTQRPTDGELASAHYATNSVEHVAWERLHAAVWPARTEETVQQSTQRAAAFWGILGGGCAFVFFVFMAQPVIR